MNRIVLIGLASAALASGCASMTGASVAVTSEKLVERTAFALGVEPSQVTIADRRDEGMMSRYRARTSAGKEYNCSISGMRIPLTPVVSDAQCTEVGRAPRNSLQR